MDSSEILKRYSDPKNFSIFFEIPLAKIFFHLRKNIFSMTKKKLRIFLDHYIALKFYEEAIFRILRAI